MTMRITCGDLDFQKTLTEKERAYIHAGNNWMSKLSREIDLKSLHSLGWTLDEVEELPEEKQDALWRDATDCWNCQDWSQSKFRKERAEPAKMPEIHVSRTE